MGINGQQLLVKRAINKFAENNDINTADTPAIIVNKAVNNLIIAAPVLADIVSTSTNDDLGDTGAEKVEVTYYQSDFNEVTATKTMDGTTQVELDDDFLFCSRLKVVQSGSGNTNAGDIRVVTRGTPANIHQQITAGEGQTLSGAQMIAKDTKGIVKCLYASFSRTIGQSSTQIRFWRRLPDGTKQVKYNILLTTDKPFENKDYGMGGIELTAGDIFYVEAVLVTTDATPISSGFDIELKRT